MKVITLCLLVLVSASCLLSTSANEVDSFSLDEEQVAMLLAEMDDAVDNLNDSDYMDIDAHITFFRSCYKVLKKCLKTIRGTNCILKAVVSVATSCTSYVDAIDACGVNVPKDVLNIVNSVKAMLTICNNIIHANSTYCNTTAEAEAEAEAADSRSLATTGKCFKNVFVASLKLVRKMNTTLKLIAKLPSDTSSCFVNATNKVKDDINNFLPTINACIDSM